MKTEQGNSYGMYSKIGWETRKKSEYPFDDNAFLFSLNKNKIYKALKGKTQICWLHFDNALYIYCSMGLNDYFLNIVNKNLFDNINNYFEDCKMEHFNSGLKEFKFLEIEVFQIEE